MNKSGRIALTTIIVLVLGFGFIFLGIIIGRSGWIPQVSRMYSDRRAMPFNISENYYARSSIQGNYMMGGPGMMGDHFFNTGVDIQPLTIDEVDQVIHEYLEDYSDNDLILGEIMIFDNHAYAQIVEKSTGIGAMEVLVDPQTRSVYPEQGPNMMWNIKYSPMGSSNWFQGRGMMSGYSTNGFNDQKITIEDIEKMPVSSDEAVDAAQRFLDQYHPGTQADEHADPFYGYYTIHVLRDGDVIGMLSVNGYNSQVFLHTWHGDLLQMSEH
jgi:hypothetical protein